MRGLSLAVPKRPAGPYAQFVAEEYGKVCAHQELSGLYVTNRFWRPPPEYDLIKLHICLVKIIKQMQPGEENAPSIDCSGNYEAAGAELGQGGKIHGAFSCFLSSI